MTAQLAAILACPSCHGDFGHFPAELRCRRCERHFPLLNGIPVFRDDAQPIAIMPAAYESNALGVEFEAILARGQELVLHLGAGWTARKYPSCVELEQKIFRHTDVVADAHALPFREHAFDRVLGFNVFEHLKNPPRATAEIFRVLKPGGSVVIHTAFLQPLHEAPNHFYNATEYGVRSWFENFKVEKCQVSPNFTAPFMLAFLLHQVLDSVGSTRGEETRQAVGQSRLQDWADFWSDRARVPALFQVLQSLPNESQSRIAAGFELIARKP